MPNRIANTNLRFDSQFTFLLELDPAFEEWRRLVAEWWAQQKVTAERQSSICAFFVTYIHGQRLANRPVALFENGAALPNLEVALGMGKLSRATAKRRHACISDFLDWVLQVILAERDDNGSRSARPQLRNPFPRTSRRNTGKQADITFRHVANTDARMESWRQLASEWLNSQRIGVGQKRHALDKFLVAYIVGCDLERNPIRFLSRETRKPPFIETLVRSKVFGAVGVLVAKDVEANNYIREFLDWVLHEKLSVEDEYHQRLVPAELQNPVPHMSKGPLARPTESVRSCLSIRYIKELRSLLAEGPHFKDWSWAHYALESGNSGGDWFVVDPSQVRKSDPDCVWRVRDTTRYERDMIALPAQVTEIWSPVRATALLLKLELPLRTYQVRMLDSGEADTWRYEHAPTGGTFVINKSHLATGSKSRPYQRGVFHRSSNEQGAGLFINTNKTADINRPENKKGYVIPWTHDTVLYWLDKLRNWQERYNPIVAPTPWLDLAPKHFNGTPPHPELLEARGATCFLFRDAAATGSDRSNPLINRAVDRLWHRLLTRLEQRCIERGEVLDDGTPMRFVDSDSGTVTLFPLHSLRVSLISYLILDLQLPIAVVSKLIAGHARIVMTLYYTKFGQAYMRDVLEEAERKLLLADESNHRRFLMDATYEQVSRRFASLSEDALRTAINQKSAAGFVFEDKGICPVGASRCDVGGEAVGESSGEKYFAPVSGYPQERNCVRCRFFLTGPAFLPGLQAHFNSISYQAHEVSVRHNDLHEQLTQLEQDRADAEHDGLFFAETRNLERLSQRYEAEAEAMGKLLNDLQACHYLVARSLALLNEGKKDGVQLVAVGDMNDIGYALTETNSELHQIEVLCQNAVIYPEIDARKPSLRRSQILDCMLEFNGRPPVFYRLNQRQQLEVGNAVMNLIQARAGSLSNALDFVEGKRRLQELGLLDETWDIIDERVAGLPARQFIDSARSNRQLLARREGQNAP